MSAPCASVIMTRIITTAVEAHAIGAGAVSVSQLGTLARRLCLHLQAIRLADVLGLAWRQFGIGLFGMRLQ